METNHCKSERLRVGVVGLRKRWEHYRSAIEKPDSPLEVRAVVDPSPRRTSRVARHIRCAAAAGTEDLLDRTDLDALLVLDAAWQGLWPLQRACQPGKPVLCAVPLTDQVGRADLICQQLRDKDGWPMMAALAGQAPCLNRLRVLLDKHLGPARLVSCTGGIGRHATEDELLGCGALLPAFHLCRELLGGAAETVSSAAPARSGMVNLTLAFGGGKAATVTLTASRREPWRFAVIAEKGHARVLLPRRLRWTDSSGEHSLRLPPASTGDIVLKRFAQAIRAGRPVRPTFADACSVLAWQRAARRSHVEGRSVRVDGT